MSDAYQWVHGLALDGAARLAVDAGDPDAPEAVDRLAELAERCGQREFVVRALAHRGRLGVPGAVESARVLAGDIDNPALQALVEIAEPA